MGRVMLEGSSPKPSTKKIAPTLLPHRSSFSQSAYVTCVLPLNPNYSGPVPDIEIRNGRVVKKSKSKQKKPSKTSQKSTDGGNKIITLASQIKEEKDETKITKMFENSAGDLYQWIQSLLRKAKDDTDILPQVLSTFPQIKENVALIHPAYEIFIATQPSYISNLAKKFRELVPAIFHMSNQLFGRSSTTSESTSSKESEYHACGLLARLIKAKTIANMDEYDKLVFETDTSELQDALKKKVDAKVSAPAILAVKTVPEMSFWIAVDYVPMKVHGTFADALQSYMEVTWLFNLEYDDMVKSFTKFFETMMGYSKATGTKTCQLYQDLLKLKNSQNLSSSSTSAFRNALFGLY